MSDQNKNTRKIEEASKPIAGASQVKPTGLKRLFSKRWVFPAVYMAAAAIIVTILWLNGSGGEKTPNEPVAGTASVESEEAAATPSGSQEALEAAVPAESLRMPYDEKADMAVSLPYYNASGSAEEREAALVEYDNKFTPHTGIDFAQADGKSFEVLAALSGKVTVAEKSPINGYEIQIEHAGGLKTVYQSLADLKVQVGDEVKQGDTIAMADRSEMEASEGIHLHFEVLNNGQPVDPHSLVKEQ
ncbi:M23 family metallopeptidase [Cohnella fermenti]|uniref:M23 family metallopeptidase n=1 Tax=Cohnella fermenti TaxID=2565925 RepID=A0A4S4BFL2_9BACL|nr:M23 family metallopeptidase [Cohnella fermenti]THF73134.1 M23 family metallopeptidase [Cohnella fermenti]